MAISKIDPAGLDIGQIGGRRNLIINGAMQVAQRGTSFTADNVYTLDRWRSSDGNGGTPARTTTQEEFSLGQTDVPNARYYLKHDQTAASTNSNAKLQHRIEDVTRFDGTTVTFSFYAKADSALSVNVRLIQNFGSGGSPSEIVTVTETGISIGTSWTKYTVTKTLGSLSGKTLGTDGEHTSFLDVIVDFKKATTFTFEATLFQLEYGDTATPFEHRSYGEELALCQRYYYRRLNSTGNVMYDLMGFGYANGSALAMIRHPVPMRAEPSFERSATDVFNILDSSGNDADSTNASISALGSVYGVAMFVGDTNLSTDENCMIRINDDDWYEFDAEL